MLILEVITTVDIETEYPHNYNPGDYATIERVFSVYWADEDEREDDVTSYNSGQLGYQVDTNKVYSSNGGVNNWEESDHLFESFVGSYLVREGSTGTTLVLTHKYGEYDYDNPGNDILRIAPDFDHLESGIGDFSIISTKRGGVTPTALGTQCYIPGGTLFTVSSTGTGVSRGDSLTLSGVTGYTDGDYEVLALSEDASATEFTLDVLYSGATVSGTLGGYAITVIEDPDSVPQSRVGFHICTQLLPSIVWNGESSSVLIWSEDLTNNNVTAGTEIQAIEVTAITESSPHYISKSGVRANIPGTSTEVFWYPKLTSSGSIQKKLSSSEGGYVTISLGNLSFSPDAFETPPPIKLGIRAYYLDSTDGSTTFLFDATAHLSNIKELALDYKLWPKEYDIELLEDAPDYDPGGTTDLIENRVYPLAFGDIELQQCLRTSDPQIDMLKLEFDAEHGYTTPDEVVTLFDRDALINVSWATEHGYTYLDEGLSFAASGINPGYGTAGSDLVIYECVDEYNLICEYAYQLSSNSGLGEEKDNGSPNITISITDISVVNSSYGSSFNVYRFPTGDLKLTVLFVAAAFLQTGNYGKDSNGVKFKIESAAEYIWQYHLAGIDSEFQVYDDGVLLENNIVIETNTTVNGTVPNSNVPTGHFETLNKPVQEDLRISGENTELNTLDKIFKWACGTSATESTAGSDRLKLKYDVSASREVLKSAPVTVAYWVDKQQMLIDFLKDLAAAYSHMFYIDSGVLHLVDMFTDNGSTQLIGIEFSTSDHTYPGAATLLTAEWDGMSTIADPLGVPTFIPDERTQEILYDNIYGSEETYAPFHRDRDRVVREALNVAWLRQLPTCQVKLPLEFGVGIILGSEVFWETDHLNDPSWVSGSNYVPYGSIRARSIQYDFDGESMTIKGEAKMPKIDSLDNDDIETFSDMVGQRNTVYTSPVTPRVGQFTSSYAVDILRLFKNAGLEVTVSPEATVGDFNTIEEAISYLGSGGTILLKKNSTRLSTAFDFTVPSEGYIFPDYSFTIKAEDDVNIDCSSLSTGSCAFNFGDNDLSSNQSTRDKIITINGSISISGIPNGKDGVHYRSSDPGYGTLKVYDVTLNGSATAGNLIYAYDLKELRIGDVTFSGTYTDEISETGCTFKSLRDPNPASVTW